MPLTHLLLALVVVTVWGTNFVVIRWGLAELPPFTFAALRFALTAFPLVLVVPRPDVPIRKLAAFGVLLGVGQFALMFYALRGHIAPGLASLLVQTQAFFTIGISMAMAGERPRPLTLVALVLAVSGMAVIARHIDATNVTALGLGLVLAAAFFWACANMVAKSVGRVNPIGFVIWSAAFAAPALALVSLALEGPTRIATSVAHASASAWGAVVYQSLANTLFGYGAWNWLLARHPAATVTPLSLLVPVFGMTASSLLLGEAMPTWKLAAMFLVFAGLALNVAATRVSRRVEG